MTHLITTLRFRIGLAAFTMAVAPTAFAQSVFNGPGLEGGTTVAGQIEGPSKSELREIIVNMLQFVLTFLALAGVVMVVIAGLYLVFSNGNDDQKNKAKSIIKYVIYGILVCLFARALIGFFTKGLPGIVG